MIVLLVFIPINYYSVTLILSIIAVYKSCFRAQCTLILINEISFVWVGFHSSVKKNRAEIKKKNFLHLLPSYLSRSFFNVHFIPKIIG